MRVIFMGTPDFSVETLEALIAAEHDVCLAVTQPDRPKGRGKETQASPVKEKALFHGIPVYQPRRVRDPECVEELRKYHADVIVVVAFGQILPASVLELTPYGCVNVHASLLPKYRGAAPIQWAIIEGETVTGVTTMQMDEGLDTGDMIMKTEVPVSEDETGETLHEKLSAAGAALCVETLRALEDGTAVFEKQGESPTAYARMLTKELGNIDWTEPAVRIERLVRGLNSWPSAYTYWNGKLMKIWRAEVLQTQPEDAGDIRPGTIAAVGRDSFTVRTGDGDLRILEVQMPGKKRMETGAFLRGNTMETGDVLSRK
ncbi:MAG TPA: methionyl-tRNA formyltransferase [Candidatus Mediterraneibacter pullistercoris]|nr:methionyl-tRNA formyltransferase [Candidatus Mediterraneibacter pullistercoris]